MKIHIVLLGSPVAVQVELPEGANFVSWCKNIKADGGIFADQLHVPYDKIIGVGVMPEGQIPTSFVNAPTTDTKQ